MTGHARRWKYLLLGALVGCAPEGQWQPDTAELEGVGQSTAALTYVEEANFDLDTEDWTTGNSYTSIARDTSRFHQGSAALLVKSTSTTETKARSPRFTVVPGRKYTARGWVIADTTARSTGLQIDWYASGGGYISSAMHYASNSTTSWGERAVIGAVAPSVAAGATADASHARIALVFKTTVSGEQHRVDSLTVTDDANTLTPSNQTFDSNSADWFAKANTTLSRDTAKVYAGSGALLLKASTAGDVKAESARFDVVAGKAYDLRGWVLADTTARNTGLQLDWFDSAGNYISSAMHYATGSTTSWQERAVVGAVAPSSAATASVSIVFKSCAGGEQHRLDNVTVTEQTASRTWQTTFSSSSPKDELKWCVENNPENLTFPTASWNGGNKVLRMELDGGMKTGYKSQSWFHYYSGNSQTNNNLGLGQLSDATIEMDEYLASNTYTAFDGVDVKTAGLAGVPETKSAWNMSSGGTKYADSWSTRIHFRKGTTDDGKVHADVYFYAIYGGGITYATNPAYGSTKYGISIPLTTDGTKTGPKITFPVNKKFTLKMRVKLNTPGSNNGLLQVWYKPDGGTEVLAVDLNDVQWNGSGYDTPINIFTNGSWYNNDNTEATTYLEHSRFRISGEP